MEPAAATEWITNEAGDVRLAADFDAVAREYWPRVFCFLVVSLRDRGDAESLTQDCFLKAFQAWRGFRGECGVNTWLMRIAVNQLRDHARNRRLQFWKRTKAAWRAMSSGKSLWRRRCLTDALPLKWAPLLSNKSRRFGVRRALCRNSSGLCFCFGSWKIWTYSRSRRLQVLKKAR